MSYMYNKNNSGIQEYVVYRPDMDNMKLKTSVLVCGYFYDAVSLTRQHQILG